MNLYRGFCEKNLSQDVGLQSEEARCEDASFQGEDYISYMSKKIFVRGCRCRTEAGFFLIEFKILKKNSSPPNMYIARVFNGIPFIGYPVNRFKKNAEPVYRYLFVVVNL